ncbi:MAG: exodeoxyribonuclease VII large subunit [Chthoniobacterales bacterium]|nr:exodeoxyribonuclease VII large subunit [Chthoniobacterales bacterium]
MKYHVSQEQAEFSFTMKPLVTKKRSRAKITPTKKEFFAERETVPLSEQLPSEDSATLEATSPRIMSVTEVTRRVKDLLEKNIGEVWIEGEISNYRKQSSGHHYFTLKDAESQIACVLFARSAATLQGVVLKEGMAVQLFGEVTVYQARGQYQLIVHLVQPKGHGLLQAKLEALKQKLATEGLFDANRKRALPRLPKRIGIVTSPTGAALADFLKVLHRRHPGLQVVIHPVRVQGQGAAQEIAAAITSFASEEKTIGPVDLIVISRGGGSLEDLWEFNEEVVVRAIVASAVPVVSAIGHEIDFTLADFAADLRAPTPSAAAELIAADSVALLEKGISFVAHLARASITALEQLKTHFFYLESGPLFRAPERLLTELQQRKDDVEETLSELVTYRCEKLSSVITTMEASLRSLHPQFQLTEAQQRWNTYQQRLTTYIKHHQILLSARIENLRSSMAALNPDATLARGFTITRDAEGKVMTSAKNRSVGEKISTQFVDGVMTSAVCFIEK